MPNMHNAKQPLCACRQALKAASFVQDVFVARLREAGMRVEVFAAAYPPEGSFRALLQLRNAVRDATGLADDAIFTLPESTAAAIEHFGAKQDVADERRPYRWLGDIGGATSDQGISASTDGDMVQISSVSVHKGGEDLRHELKHAECIVRSKGLTPNGEGVAELGMRANYSEVEGFIDQYFSDDLSVSLGKLDDYRVDLPGWKLVKTRLPKQRRFLVHWPQVRVIVQLWAATILAVGSKDVRVRPASFA